MSGFYADFSDRSDSFCFLCRLTDDIQPVTSCWRWRGTRRSVSGGWRRRKPTGAIKVTITLEHTVRNQDSSGSKELRQRFYTRKNLIKTRDKNRVCRLKVMSCMYCQTCTYSLFVYSSLCLVRLWYLISIPVLYSVQPFGLFVPHKMEVGVQFFYRSDAFRLLKTCVASPQSQQDSIWIWDVPDLTCRVD